MTAQQRRWTWFEVFFVSTALLFAIFILYPWLLWGGGNTRYHAKRTACISSLKQLGTMMAIYAADHDDRLPISSDEKGAVGWLERSSSYIEKDCSSLFCPEDYAKHRQEGLVSGTRRFSYAMNMNLSSLPKLSSCSNPERTVLLFEAESIIAELPSGEKKEASLSSLAMIQPGLYSPAGSGVLDDLHGGLPGTNILHYATGPMSNSNLEGTDPRHQDRACFLFLDTHARAHIPKEISAGRSALKLGDAESWQGCAGGHPCAESVAVRNQHLGTFSIL